MPTTRIAITGANSAVGNVLLTEIANTTDTSAVAIVRREGALKGLPTGPSVTTAVARYEDSAALRAALAQNAQGAMKSLSVLHPRVRQHWLSHTGFSFPSGHSLNAFLFAVLLASLLAHHPRLSRGWIYVPFMWAAGVCLSRVALGAHTLLDVAVGALAGGAIGLGLMSLGFLRRWLLLEDSPIALREWVGDSKVRG